jgi:N-acetylglucosamine-6-phosphate deacetylase
MSDGQLGDIDRAGNAADVWSLNSEAADHYYTPMLPVEVHCHGFGGVDFSEFATLDLELLDRQAAEEGVLVIPTLYLHRDRLPDFERFMADYDRKRRGGALPRIIGVALEGPLLASHGGTPADTVWNPTRREWERLAGLARFGLLYTVLSPDAFSSVSELSAGPDTADLDWIIPVLVSHGLRPALGHFTKADPVGSAAMVEAILDLAEATAFGGRGARVVTDHLFNDMPLKIRQAFRTSRARRNREETLRSYDIPNWRLADMTEIAGPVPSAIMRGAAAGRLAACLNFDGEHVDLTIATKAAELMGFANTMMMTDRCDSARLGGQQLHRVDENSLWYQSNGIVAAGSQPLDRQMGNARAWSVAEADVWALSASTIYSAFGFETGPAGGSFVHRDSGLRSAVTSVRAE